MTSVTVVIPGVAVKNVAMGAGEFLQMLGAYTRKGMVETPKVRLISRNISLNSSLIGRVFRFIMVTILVRPAALVKLQTSEVLHSSTFESSELRMKHPSLVLDEWASLWCSVVMMQSVRDRNLSFTHSASRLFVDITITTLTIVRTIRTGSLNCSRCAWLRQLMSTVRMVVVDIRTMIPEKCVKVLLTNTLKNVARLGWLT